MLMATTVKIWGCGGTGINQLDGLKNIPTGGAYPAKIELVGIDTSSSNPFDGDYYRVKGMTGAAKDRPVAFEELSKSNIIPEIVDQFEPGDFNIVIGSGGGGTGSVVMPLLTGELLKRGHTTVILFIHTDLSSKEAENSYKTFAGFAGMSSTVYKKPFVVVPYMNSDTGRHIVDMSIYDTVGELAVLVSGAHRGLDAKDIDNLFDYTRVTKAPPQLTLLDLRDSDTIAEYKGFEGVIATGFVTQSLDNVTIPFEHAYNCEGEYTANTDMNDTYAILTAKGTDLVLDNMKQIWERRQSADAAIESVETKVVANESTSGLMF